MKPRTQLLLVAILTLNFSPLAAQSDVRELAETLANGTEPEKRKAAYALRSLGAEAEPALPELIEGLEGSEQVWFNSVMTIASIGPDAIAAKDRLIEALKDPGRGYDDQIRYRSAYALGNMGTAVIPDLVELFQHQDPETRASAVQALGWMESQAVEAVNEVLNLLGDPEPRVVSEAAKTLGAMRSAALGPVMERLKSNSSTEQIHAALALRELGPEARPAAELLIDRIDKPQSPEFLSAALSALGRMGLSPEKVGHVLVYHLTSDNPDVADAAFEGLLRQREITGSTVVALISMLQSNDSNVERIATKTLERIGQRAAAAIPALIDRQENGSAAAFSALSSMGPPAARAALNRIAAARDAKVDDDSWEMRLLNSVASQSLPELEEALEHASPAARLASLRAMRAVIAPPKETLPKILKLANDPEAPVRAECLATAAHFKIDPNRLRLQLQAGLNDPAPIVRETALLTIPALGRDAAALKGAIRENLENGETILRAAALKALAAIGEDSPEFLETTLEFLKADAFELNVAALETLTALGNKAESALPLILKKEANEPSDKIRPTLLETMAAIAPENADVFSRLKQAVQASGSPETVRAALRSLANASFPQEETLPIYLSLLDEPNDVLRRQALKAIGAFGESANQAASFILPLLDQPNDRGAALNTLRQLRSPDPELYTKILANDDAGVRLFAAEALERMTSGRRGRRELPEATVEQLQIASKDSYFPVRRAARETLENVRH